VIAGDSDGAEARQGLIAAFVQNADAVSERAIARRSVFQKMFPTAVGKTADRSWLAMT
jgi:hypothetical protein